MNETKSNNSQDVKNSQSQYICRLDKKLKDDFNAACKSSDIATSSVIRNFMREYIKKSVNSYDI